MGVHGAAGANGAAGATGTAGAAGTGGAGGADLTTVRATIASVIEALARGESVCPGQVTITPKTATPACAGGNATEERNGVTLVFNGCVVSGATINGTFDVLSNRAASEQTCSATTTITLGHTTTITNLSISDSNGKIVIPSQTDTGMTSYTFGQTPTTTTFNITGEMQTFSATGTMIADLTYTGMDTVTFSGEQLVLGRRHHHRPGKERSGVGDDHQAGAHPQQRLLPPDGRLGRHRPERRPAPRHRHLDLRALLRNGDAEQRHRHAARLYLNREHPGRDLGHGGPSRRRSAARSSESSLSIIR